MYLLRLGRCLFRLAVCVLPVFVSTLFSPVVAQNAGPIEISLHPYADTPLKTVQVRVGDREVPFLVDTGGGLTFVSPDVVGELGCEPFGEATGFRADGEKVAFPRCGPVNLAIDGYRVRDEVGVFDLMAMIRKQVEQARKQGKDVSMPPALGGMIALPSFRHHAVTLDYARDRIIIETPQSLRRRIASMRPLKIRMATLPSGGMEVFVQAQAKKGNRWLQLDSGNNGPTFLAPHSLQQLGIAKTDEPPEMLNLQLTDFDTVQTQVKRRAMIYDGQLGLDLIRKLVITLDLESGRAWAIHAGRDGDAVARARP